MTTYESYITCANDTDANFRIWGKWISDNLTALGITKTADTGQIDWTTVTRPLATNTAQGYEIRKFNDALDGTYPQYFKIEYGSGGATDRPSIWLTTGTGSNGSGTLTGFGLARVQLIFWSANNGATTPCAMNMAGDASGFVLVPGVGLYSNSSPVIALERTVDANGAITGEGTLLTRFIFADSISSVYYNQRDAASTGQQLYHGGGLLPRPCVSGISGYIGLTTPIAKYVGWGSRGLHYGRMVAAVDAPADIQMFYPTIFGSVRAYRGYRRTLFGVRAEATGGFCVWWN